MEILKKAKAIVKVETEPAVSCSELSKTKAPTKTTEKIIFNIIITCFR